MNKLSKSEKILLGILGIAILFYIYYTFLLNPVLNKITTSNSNIKSYNSQLQSLVVKETETKKLQTQYDELKLQYDEVLKSYPKWSDVPQIAYDLKKLGDSSGISLNSITVSDPKKIDTKLNNNEQAVSNQETAKNKEKITELYNISLNISITGDYDKVKNFIKMLETEERATEIVVSSLVKDAQLNVVNTAITANFYFITDKNNKDINSYEFNRGTYGKIELFK